jgi:hypothetical protein
MLHWYRLADEMLRPRSSCQVGSGVGVLWLGSSESDGASQDLFGTYRIRDARGKIPDFWPTESLSPEQGQKFFWLGLIEAVPLIAGGAFSICTDSNRQSVIAALAATVVTALICWLLRDQVPPTRIELTASGPNRAVAPTSP